MKQLTKRIIERLLNPISGMIAREVSNSLLDPLQRKRLDEIGSVDRAIQLMLMMKYEEMRQKKQTLPRLEDAGFRSFSQNSEDGLLLYLFTMLGTKNKEAVEICAGDGIECNTANLIVNHGWRGLLCDGDAGRLAVGRQFYKRCPDTRIWPPTLVAGWITAENVNDVILSHGFSGPIDLLSLDIDGIDYWVWKAVECIQPRVVVLEYVDFWGPERSVTVPYRSDFRGIYDEAGLLYGGASLSAFVKLGRSKGYRLVGCERYGFNAFFVRNGEGEDVLPEVSAADCCRHPRVAESVKLRRPLAERHEWVEV